MYWYLMVFMYLWMPERQAARLPGFHAQDVVMYTVMYGNVSIPEQERSPLSVR